MQHYRCRFFPFPLQDTTGRGLKKFAPPVWCSGTATRSSRPSRTSTRSMQPSPRRRLPRAATRFRQTSRGAPRQRRPPTGRRGAGCDAASSWHTCCVATRSWPSTSRTKSPPQRYWPPVAPGLSSRRAPLDDSAVSYGLSRTFSCSFAALRYSSGGFFPPLEYPIRGITSLPGISQSQTSEHPLPMKSTTLECDTVELIRSFHCNFKHSLASQLTFDHNMQCGC